MEKPIVNICIIHFNTPTLTECLVKSINKFTPNSKIYIFDNSDKTPFIYRQDNLVYFNNTQGQIINFDEWLKKYPKRTLSNAKINQWGSAKHAYTVQKCIELIPEGFILMDSDVLITTDITELVDTTCTYVAETELQPNSNITRVIPFICYINSKLLKENNITYFNENYMHGLKGPNNGDQYDTGAWFYLSANKTKHKSISCNNYIIHFKGASWNDIHETKYGKNISSEEWLNIHKNLYADDNCKNTKVIYTCITNGYDSLYEIQSYISDYDFICYTDNPHLKSRTWEIRNIPDHIKTLSYVKQQRYIKTHPHELFPEYDISIWIDGNIDILEDPTPLINEYCVEVPEHPARNCIYKEGKECIAQRKDTSTNINKQLNRYKKEGFPNNYGLIQSGIIIRRHNNEKCIKLMNAWWNEIEKGSHRDQLSFNYVLWKNNDIDIFYLDKTLFKSKYFYWNKGHGNKERTMNVAVKIPNHISIKQQLLRPNKVHIESSWNPLESKPKAVPKQAALPPPQVKNNNDKVVHIKRLFY